MTVLDPDSADLTLLQDRQVAVLGFDQMAAAHALNLRDSGVDVRVGTSPDGRGAARAEMEGILVMDPAEAVQHCDVVLVAVGGDEGGREHDLATVQSLLQAHTDTGDLVVVTSGEPVRTGQLTVPDGVDLAMLRSVGDGERVREEYLDGRGCPALVAVARDQSGAAWATLTAYAAAMGALRSGAIVTTLAHEARAARYAEAHVYAPLWTSMEDAFDALVGSGVEPEVAYLAVVHELKTRVDQVYAAGLASQFGPDAQPGSDPADGAQTRRAAHEAAHPLEQVGRAVRAMMSWIR